MGPGTMGNDQMIGSGMMNGRMSSGMMVDNQSMMEGMIMQMTEADQNITGSIPQ